MSDYKNAIAEAIEALEISIGYTALVSGGYGELPILKSRAKSDTAIIAKALEKLTALQEAIPDSLNSALAHVRTAHDFRELPLNDLLIIAPAAIILNSANGGK
jgi:hypothetical protein